MQSIKVKFEYPAKLSRGLLLLKTFFGWLYVGIPHGICLGVLGLVSCLVYIIAWFAVLFTGKYPRSLFSFMTGLYNWALRVTAYLGYLRDEYPSFGLEASYPASFHAEYPAKLSRGLLLLRTFFGCLYVMIPHGFCLSARIIAHCIVAFIAWWAILFTGKIPASMFSFMSGTLRWYYNLGAYMAFLTDEYPPLSGKSEGVTVKPGVAA